MSAGAADAEEAVTGGVTARRGALTFGGSIVQAAAGFLLAVVVGRGLGTSGAGVFFAIASLFLILSTVLKLGLDTTLLWRVPRLLSAGRVADVSLTLRQVLVPTVAASVVVGSALILTSGWVGQALVADPPATVGRQVAWAGVALTAMAPMAVLVAYTRGLGLIRPFVMIQTTALPVARLVAVTTVVLLGAGGVAVVAAWSLPVLLCSAAAAVVVHRHHRRLLAGVRTPQHPPRPLGELRAQLWRFAAPRGVTASIEATLATINVLVVGVLLGASPAGVFGALSRFVTTGTLAEQAVRVLVAPRFSSLLGERDLDGATRLYARTTPWIVAVSAPVFMVVGVGAPAVLTVFGPGFGAGAGALGVLAVAMVLSQLAGNVQTILLMSGRSGLQLGNRVIAVVVLLGLDVLLIPRYGLTGAALAWAASILVDTALALVEVRLLVGVRFAGGRLVARLLAVSAITFALPVYAAVHLLEAGLPGLLVAATLGGIAYLALLWAWRGQLAITELRASARVPAPTTHEGPR